MKVFVSHGSPSVSARVSIKVSVWYALVCAGAHSGSALAYRSSFVGGGGWGCGCGYSCGVGGWESGGHKIQGGEDS